MTYCNGCGAQLGDNDKFCPACGAPVGAPNAQGGAQYAAAPVVQPRRVDFTGDMPAEDIERGRVLSMLCYVNVAFIVLALVAEQGNRFVRFHANQALVLSICSMLAALCAIVPFLGWAVAAVGEIVIFVFTIIGFFNASGRRAKEVPAVGNYRPLKDLK